MFCHLLEYVTSGLKAVRQGPLALQATKVERKQSSAPQQNTGCPMFSDLLSGVQSGIIGGQGDEGREKCDHRRSKLLVNGKRAVVQITRLLSWIIFFMETSGSEESRKSREKGRSVSVYANIVIREDCALCLGKHSVPPAFFIH